MTDEKKIPAAKTVVDSSIKLFRTYVDAANKLPANDDYAYHSVFPGFVEVMADHKERLDKIVNAFANAAVSPQRQRKLLSTESRNRVLDVVDMMFENIDTLLDEVHGAKMSAEAQNAAFSSASGGASSSTVMDAESDDPNTIEAARHSKSFAASSSGPSSAAGTTLARKVPLVAVARPQLSFNRPVDNSPEPFKHLVFDNESGDLRYGEVGVHPHKAVIEGFSYAPDQLRYREELLPVPLSASTLHFVTNLSDLNNMIDNHLAKSKEIAIDLEHHDAHSYQGITCLMQISTRSDDFLVDVFPLRDHLHRLNKVFLDTKIVKILHGCKEDIRWLQKDFGCYIANLFDTGVALQTLHMPYSLAFAVDHYCQVKLNKQYQRADWRVRPIPADMAHYARQDTHYLLYIYDRLSNQLLQQEGGRAAVLGNLLVHVLNESRQLCLLQYEKPHFDANTSFKDGLGKGLLGLTPAQTERARLAYNWREETARVEDESPLAVMHPSSIIQLATSPAFSRSNLPTATQLLRSIHPLSMAVRSRIKALVDVLSTPAAYPEDESASSAAHNNFNSVSSKSAAHSASAMDDVRRQRRQHSHYPLTGTLPSLVMRNANSMGLTFETDVDLNVASDIAATAVEAPSSPLTAVSSSPSAFSQEGIYKAQRDCLRKMASVYSSVLPPSSPCLARKPAMGTGGIALESYTDSLGIVRPAVKESLLMKAIREEKANASVQGGEDGTVVGGALPDTLEFSKENEGEDADMAEAKLRAEKRAREEGEEESTTTDNAAAPHDAAGGVDSKVPISLKEQFGLGRSQRKKIQHRKE